MSYDTLAKNKLSIFRSVSIIVKLKEIQTAISCEMERGLHKCVDEVTCDRFALILINI